MDSVKGLLSWEPAQHIREYKIQTVIIMTKNGTNAKPLRQSKISILVIVHTVKCLVVTCSDVCKPVSPLTDVLL